MPRCATKACICALLTMWIFTACCCFVATSVIYLKPFIKVRQDLTACCCWSCQTRATNARCGIHAVTVLSVCLSDLPIVSKRLITASIVQKARGLKYKYNMKIVIVNVFRPPDIYSRRQTIMSGGLKIMYNILYYIIYYYYIIIIIIYYQFYRDSSSSSIFSSAAPVSRCTRTLHSVVSPASSPSDSTSCGTGEPQGINSVLLRWPKKPIPL